MSNDNYSNIIDKISEFTNIDSNIIKQMNHSQRELERKLKIFEDRGSDTQFEIELLTNKAKKIIENQKNMQYFIIKGSWKTWVGTLFENSHSIGFDESNSQNLEVYNKIQINDYVIFAQNNDEPKKFSKASIFGYGKITNKFKMNADENPNALRLEFEPIFISDNDSNIILLTDENFVDDGISHVDNLELLNKIKTKIDKNWDQSYLNEKYLLVKKERELNYDENNLLQYSVPNNTTFSQKLVKDAKIIFYSNEDSFRIFGNGTISKSEINSSDKLSIKFEKFNFSSSNKNSKKNTGKIIPQLILDELNKINLNFNEPIIPVKKSIFELIIPSTFSDSQLSILSEEKLKSGVSKITSKLLVSPDKILEIVNHLISGRHILLTGPVGTGKTSIGMMIPEIFGDSESKYVSEEFTATNDWTTQDIIGGIFPKMRNEHDVMFDIQYGCVTETVLQNWENGVDQGKRTNSFRKDEDGILQIVKGIWLVIDEFNRADIDKAFGQLFTALRTKKLKIPTNIATKSYLDLKIPEDYRIIGTLNTSDKHYLFELSDALKSRFAHVEIEIPSKKEKDQEIFFALKNAAQEIEYDFEDYFQLDETKKSIIKKDENFFNAIDSCYNILSLVRIFKGFGTAILKLIYQNILGGVVTNMKYYNSVDYERLVDLSIVSNILPLIENLTKTDLEIVNSLVNKTTIQFIEKIHEESNIERYEESLKKLLKTISKESQYDKILQSSREELKEICIEIEPIIQNDVSYGDFNLKNTTRELKEMLTNTIF
jgi:MoxR-like ATPase